MEERKPTNADIARELEDIADLLDIKQANTFRIRAYRQGARQVRDSEIPLAECVLEGREERLRDVPDIGEGLAGVIAEYVMTGRTGIHQELLGEVSPEDVFKQLPGIGDDLARRMVESLGLKTLEELERAAHDGRLEQVDGFGERRVEMVRAVLAGMLGRPRRRRAEKTVTGDIESSKKPPVRLLLEIDREYRERAAAGKLRKIAPKRFNPEGEPWLPVMSTRKGGWDFTVLYSNTPQAHKLDKLHDWVVIYYDREGSEDQVTVVTDTLGPLGKKRVIRGRERESIRHYSSRET